MKLKVECKQCKQGIVLPKVYSTRPELISHMGEYFSLECENCMGKKKYHANDVEAFNRFKFNYVGTLIGIVIIIFFNVFLFNLGFISTAGFLIGGAVIVISNWNFGYSNIELFNKYKVVKIDEK
jgi:hypothetical protein